jgi:3-deoxy-D-manno-octulosonate 8-phosphate phosphatase KdsC-like HAD superfamily phosphatase
LKLSPEQMCYIGDDLTDLPVIRHAGLGVAVADAAEVAPAAR